MSRRARDAAIIVIHTRAASIHPSKEGLQKLSCKIEKGVTTQFWEPILTLRNMIAVHESNLAYLPVVQTKNACSLSGTMVTGSIHGAW